MIPTQIGDPEKYKCIPGLVARINELDTNGHAYWSKFIASFNYRLRKANALSDDYVRKDWKGLMWKDYKNRMKVIRPQDDQRLKDHVLNYIHAKLNGDYHIPY